MCDRAGGCVGAFRPTAGIAGGVLEIRRGRCVCAAEGSDDPDSDPDPIREEELEHVRT